MARRLLVLLPAVGLALGGLAVVAPTSTADGLLVQHVYNTGGEGLFLHPDSPTIGSGTSDLMPDGTELDLTCWATGDDVNGDAVWDYGTNASTGNAGYAADFYIDTNVTQGQEGAQLTSQGLPECGSASPAPAAQLPNAFYNRDAAVNWALANAQDPQINGDECTWFVSNALWNGGFPQDATWTASGSHGRGNWPGSETAWVVTELRDYLTANYSVTTEGPFDLSQNAMPDAEPGDILLYSWDSGHTWSHMSFVVDIAPGQYPEVSEWGTTSFYPWNYVFNPSDSYQKRGWTWSARSNPPTWLQDPRVYNGQARVMLLHINGGVYTGTY